MEFPRLLVLTSNNFNLVTGGGITLTNLFRAWPKDRIANLHEDPQPQDETVCENTYKLTDEEIRLTWPFSMVAGQSGGSAASLSGADNGSSLLLRASRAVFGDGIPRRFFMSERLKRWLDQIQPEIIYSFLGSMAQIRATAAITNQYSASLAVHIMDDWPAVLYRSGLLGPHLRRVVLAEFTTLLRKSTVRLAICEEMCEEYGKRFGCSFRPFHNAVDINEWGQSSRKSWKAGSPFVVRYAGSILQEAQQEALRDVCAAVSSLRGLGAPIEMWVHAPVAQRRYLETFSFSGLHLEDSPEPSRIIDLLSSADLLTLPFNFNERSAEYMRLSMPTKVPAYMASGTPVLVYGPRSIAPVRYALREGWGYVVFTPGVDVVRTAIQKLMENERLRQAHGRRAQALARERHDVHHVSAEFQRVLMDAAQSPSAYDGRS